jgi:hypothetical protein
MYNFSREHIVNLVPQKATFGICIITSRTWQARNIISIIFSLSLSLSLSARLLLVVARRKEQPDFTEETIGTFGFADVFVYICSGVHTHAFMLILCMRNRQNLRIKSSVFTYNVATCLPNDTKHVVYTYIRNIIIFLKLC